MAKRTSADVGFLLIDGFDVLGDTTKISDNLEALIEDTTPLGQSWARQEYVGVQKVEIEQDGYYNAATGAINQALTEQEGATRVLCYNIDGNVAGRPFTGFDGAMQAKYNRVMATSELHKASASYMGNGALNTGIILLPYGLQELDGDSEADKVDNGAQSTGGGVGYLQVAGLDLDGGTKCVVKILDSANGTDFATILTFGDVTAAPAAEVKAITATVRRYLAVSWAFTAGTAPDIKLFVGFKRNN